MIQSAIILAAMVAVIAANQAPPPGPSPFAACTAPRRLQQGSGTVKVCR